MSPEEYENLKVGDRVKLLDSGEREGCTKAVPGTLGTVIATSWMPGNPSPVIALDNLPRKDSTGKAGYAFFYENLELMSHEFKVGDKVRVVEMAGLEGLKVNLGDEGKVTRIADGFLGSPGAIVSNEKWKPGAQEYGEHGVWLGDTDIELVS